MSNLLKCCCGTGCTYWVLVKCSNASQVIDSPKYVYTRCDIYELQTGDSAANCPSDWTPDPYAVWRQDPSPCTELDPACGFFRCAADLLVAPIQITTAAVTQGLQTTPPLPVSDVCPADPNTAPFTLASRSELLAWLDPDDCCSEDCGGIAGGAGIPCHLLNSDPCTVALSEIASRTQFRWLAPAGSAYGGNGIYSGGWSASVTVGTLPSSWTIVQDGGGVNNSSYTLEFDVPVTVNYSVEVECRSDLGCTTTPTTQSFAISGSFTVRAQVLGVTALNCSSKNLVVVSGGVIDFVANTTCAQTGSNWYGGFGRIPSADIYCAHPGPAVISFTSNNYIAFAFAIARPSILPNPVCVEEAFGTTYNPYGYLELITPLGDPSDHC